MSAHSFILFGRIIIHINMEDNQTFDVCCSMVCTFNFVEQNKILCACIKYGCQLESSYGSMCANVVNFIFHSYGLQLITIIQLHTHYTKYIIIDEPLCFIIVQNLTLWFYGLN
jgi:hypothetical protein